MEALILAALAAVVYWGLCTARERQRGCPGGRGGTETVPAAEKEPGDPETAAAALEPAPAEALGRRFPGCTASLAGREIFLSNDD